MQNSENTSFNTVPACFPSVSKNIPIVQQKYFVFFFQSKTKVCIVWHGLHLKRADSFKFYLLLRSFLIDLSHIDLYKVNKTN